MQRHVGIRWTIGDVALAGFEALRLSVWGAYRIFGETAEYTIFVNSLPLERARELTGDLPERVTWRAASGKLPDWLLPYVDLDTMVEGKAWKFDPLRAFPDCWEIALDNDCILWEAPASLRTWLEEGDPAQCLIAADVVPAHGVFAPWAGPQPANAGIRGTPPGYDLGGHMRRLLEEYGAALRSELDEQGLQVAAVSRLSAPAVVELDEVTITSPFPPHLPDLGSCGAHFVGLNEKLLPWELEGRPATDWIREHWVRHRLELYRRVEVPLPEHQGRPWEAPDVV